MYTMTGHRNAGRMVKGIMLIAFFSVLLMIPLASAVTTYLETSATSRIVGESPSELVMQMQRDEITINDATYYTTDHVANEKDDILVEMFGSNLNTSLIPAPALFDKFDWIEVTAAVNNMDDGELFILESDGGLNPLHAKSGFDKFYIPEVRQWQDSFEQHNPLMVFDAPHSGSYLPKEDTFVSRLVRDSTIISSTSFNTDQFTKSFLCQLADGKTVGQIYREARNFHYNGGSKTKNGNYLGLILQSYSLYGNPLQEISMDWSETDRQSIKKKCNNFLQNLAPTIEYIGDYGPYSVFRKHLYFEIPSYQVLELGNMSIINASNTYQEYVLYDLVLPKATRTTKFPKNTIFLNWSLEQVYDDVLVDAPNLASFEGTLQNRTCQYETLNYTVDFSNSYADFSQNFVADIKPVQVINCTAGEFRLFTKFNYSVDYIVMSPVLVDEVRAPSFVYANEPLVVDISVMQLEDTNATGSLAVFDESNNKLWEYEVVDDTLDYQALFYAPADEGMKTFSVEFLQGNETLHYMEFETYVTLLEIMAQIPDSVSGEPTIPVNLKSYYPENYQVDVEYYLFNDTQLMAENEFQLTAIEGDNLVYLNFTNLLPKEQSYTLTVEASYLGEEKTSSFALVTNNAPRLALSATSPVYEFDEVLIQCDYNDIDMDVVTISIDDSAFTLQGSNFTWMTSAGDWGNHTISVNATDGLLTTTREMTFEVKKHRDSATYYGEVRYDNYTLVEENKSVLAYINDTFYAGVLVENGFYEVVIDEDNIETEWKDGGESGDIIEFFLEGVNATPTAIWTAGANQNLNLQIPVPPDNIPPTISSVNATSPQGFGAPAEILARAQDSDGNITSVIVEIQDPVGGSTNHIMQSVGADYYAYNYTNYLNGTYQYTVYVTDDDEGAVQMSGAFDMFVDFDIVLETTKEEYDMGQMVELSADSSLLNVGLTDSQIFLLMQLKHAPPGVQPLTIATIFSSTSPISIEAGGLHDISAYWNANAWNSSDSPYGESFYRVSVELVNDEGQILQDLYGNSLNWYDDFFLANSTVVCNSDDDCPADYYVGSAFCDSQNISVLQTLRDYYCDQPGTENSSCIYDEYNVTMENCSWGCSNGQCSDPPLANLSPSIEVDSETVVHDQMFDVNFSACCTEGECGLVHASLYYTQTPDLVSYWPMDGDAQDVVGVNNGSVVGAEMDEGFISEALRFERDDDEDHVQIDDHESLHITEAITFSAFIKPETLTRSYIAVKWGSLVTCEVSDSDGTLTCGLWIGPSTVRLFQHCCVSQDEWTHLAYTYDMNKYPENNTFMYVNGVQVLEAANNMPISINSSNALFFGGLASGNSLYYDGLIDEIALYSRGLTVEEVNIMYDHYTNSMQPMDEMIVLYDYPPFFVSRVVYNPYLPGPGSCANYVWQVNATGEPGSRYSLYAGVEQVMGEARWNSSSVDLTIMQAPEVECFSDADCSADTYLDDPFCSGLDVLQSLRNYTCMYPGTPESFCDYQDTDELIEICEYECSLGECVECNENWNCTQWSECIEGMQTRNCEDLNNCQTENNKPMENRSCHACSMVLSGDFTLSANLWGCEEEGILIAADGVSLDCSGHEIIGPGQVGIYINENDNINVRNCKITDFVSGINVTHSDNLTVSNVTITQSGSAFSSYFMNYAKIEQSKFDSNDEGVCVYSSDVNIIRNNIFTNNAQHGILIGADSQNNVIHSNEFAGNSINAYESQEFPATSWSSTTGNYWDDYPQNPGFVNARYEIEGPGDGIDMKPIWSYEGNSPPSLEIQGDLSVFENETVTVNLVGDDPEGDILNYSIVSDVFLQNGSVFTWETSDGSSGIYSFTASVTDAQFIIEKDFLVGVFTPTNVCGDLNCDANVDVADLTYFVQYLFGTNLEPCDLNYANVNGKDNIDVSDLTYFISYMFSSGPALSCSTPGTLSILKSTDEDYQQALHKIREIN